MSGDNIDERVVSMKFDNSDFEKKVSGTISVLDKLKSALNFGDSTKSLDGLQKASKNVQDLSAAGDKFSLDGMARAVDTISSRFSALGAVGFSVIQNLTQTALQFGERTASMLIDPVKEAGKQRALDIEHARFIFRSLGKDEEAALASSKRAVQGTAYGLGAASKAGAQLAASGIDTGAEMEGILRGIAGAAAMTGASFDEIAYVFTSSAAAGKVTNQDLQQFATRGLNAAAAYAKQTGMTEAAVHEMATNGELDFKSFSAAMTAQLGDSATKANETYAGSLANVRAALSRLGASFFTPHLLQMRDLFNTLTPVIDKIAEAILPLINAFTVMIGLDILGLMNGIKNFNLGPLTDAIPGLISGFSSIFKSVHDIAKVIKEAFKDVFPPQTESVIVTISKVFAFLAAVLTPTEEVLHAIRGVFRGLFSILAIGFAIVKDIAIGFLYLFRVVKPGGIGILNVFGAIGDALFELKKVLLDGGGIDKFFASVFGPIGSFLGGLDLPGKFSAIGEALGKFKDKLVQIFSDNIYPKIKPIIDALVSFKDTVVSIFKDNPLGKALGDIGDSTGRVKDRWESLTKAGEKLGELFGWIGDKVGKAADWFKDFIPKIADALKSGDYNLLYDALNVGVFAVIAIAVTKFFANFLDNGFIGLFVGGDFATKIKGTIGAVTQTLKAMETELKAEALLKIAEALAVLTVSLVVLSLIDSVALSKALAAAAAGFTELGLTMHSLNKNITGGRQAAEVVAGATSILILSGALLIFAIAVKFLSTMDPLELTRGLTSVSVLLLGIATAVKLMGKAEHMVATAVAIYGLAVAVGRLAGSVKNFGEMDFGTLKQGLASVVLLLGVLALTIRAMPEDAELKGAGLLLLAGALLVLTKVVDIFGVMDIDTLRQGLLVVGALMTMIALSVALMGAPKRMEEIAVGIIAIAAALVILTIPVKIFGDMDLGSLAKGLLGLGWAMGLLAVASWLFSNDKVEKGSKGIISIAFAVGILAAALWVLDKIGLGGILLVTAGVLAFISALGLLAFALDATGVTVMMAALGGALELIGTGLAFAGLGMLLFSAGIYVLVLAIEKMAEIGPGKIQMVADRLGELAHAASNAAIDAIKMFLGATPQLMYLFGKAVKSFAQMIKDTAPDIAAAAGELVSQFMKFIRDHVGEYVQTGYTVLLAFLQGMNDHIVEITYLVTEIITKFLLELSEKMPMLIDSGALLLNTILDGITKNLPALVKHIQFLLLVLIVTISQNMDPVIKAAGDLAVQFIDGIKDEQKHINEAIGRFVAAIIVGIGANIEMWIRTAAAVAVHFVEAMAETIDQNSKPMDEAIRHFTRSLVEGIIHGLAAGVGGINDALFRLSQEMLSKIVGFWHINSPSKVTMGVASSIAEGFALGFQKDSMAANGAETLGNGILTSLKDSLSNTTIDPSVMWDSNPTITPVLDLTNVKKGASDMNNLWQSPAIDPKVSTQQAVAISAEQQWQSVVKEQAMLKPAPLPTHVELTQINNSPKALSASEIYRQTNSILTLAKEHLTKS